MYVCVYIYIYIHTHTNKPHNTHRVACNGSNDYQGISETFHSPCVKFLALYVCFILLSHYKLAPYASLFDSGIQLPIVPKFYIL